MYPGRRRRRGGVWGCTYCKNRIGFNSFINNIVKLKLLLPHLFSLVKTSEKATRNTFVFNKRGGGGGGQTLWHFLKTAYLEGAVLLGGYFSQPLRLKAEVWPSISGCSKPSWIEAGDEMDTIHPNKHRYKEGFCYVFCSLPLLTSKCQVGTDEFLE